MTGQPETIGRFAVLRSLGEGGMGIVYLARDEQLDREVAIKVLEAAELTDPARRSRFLEEARAAAAIRHPNVATIYEVGETTSGEPYIVMEYCRGRTISDVAAEQKISAERFLTIAAQIASGVAAAHDRGIVHRDIKGANIILEDADIVKILDFGLAKRFEPTQQATSSWGRTTSTGFFGTVPYISPEQARGQSADVRSDLFSAGVVLYELATGHLPFVADNPLGVIEAIREKEPSPFEPVDPRLGTTAGALISRLLQKNPADRFHNAHDLANAIEDASSRLSTSEPTLRTQRRYAFGQTVRKHDRAVLMMMFAALGFVVTAAAAVILLQQRKAEPTLTPADQPIASIAVLPLRNASGRTEDEFLSIGIADALTTKFQQMSALHVRPTSSVLRLKGSNLQPRRAAEVLSVDGIVDGQFLTSGSKVRVTIQLTDARTGYGVWAETIDGSREDLLALLDDVSTRAMATFHDEARQLNTPRTEPRTANAQAFEYYLKARSMRGTLRPEQHAESIALLRRAIELDPRFAAAYADLAVALSLGQIRGMSNTAGTYELAENYAREAVRLDPNLPEAHLALGRAIVRFPGQFPESVRQNLAALELDPRNSRALYTVVTFFVSTGDMAKIDCVGRRFVSSDPSSHDARTRGYWFVNAVSPEEAIVLATEALSDPDTELAGHDILALSYIALGDIPTATREQQSAAKLAPNHFISRSLAAMIAAANNDREGAARAIELMRADAEQNHWAALRVVQVYAKLGMNEEAIEWLQTASRLGNHSWYFLLRHPWVRPLHSDPRFQKVVADMKADLDAVRPEVVETYSRLCPSR